MTNVGDFFFISLSQLIRLFRERKKKLQVSDLLAVLIQMYNFKIRKDFTVR